MDAVTVILVLIIIVLIILIILFIRGDIISPRGIRKTFEDDNDDSTTKYGN